jgi:COP9 signalosome complex subunit 2
MPFNTYVVFVSIKRPDKRLSAKTNLKLAKLWLDRREYSRLTRVCYGIIARITYFLSVLCIQLIRELHSVTETSANGEDQSQKGTQLLEIYALEIQMHNETKNYKKLKASSRLKLHAHSDANSF